MCGDVILVSSFSLYLSTTIVCTTMYFFSVFLFLLVWQFLFLVVSFDGLRPVLVTSQPIRSLANKLRSFVRSVVPVCLSVWLYVCQATTFGSFQVGRFFSLIQYISREYESSSYIKVIGSRSRSQKQKPSKITIPAT